MRRDRPSVHQTAVEIVAQARRDLRIQHGADVAFQRVSGPPSRWATSARQRREAEATESLAAALGRRVEWFRTDERVGAFRTPEIIAINTRSGRPYRFLLGHEFGHDIERNAPDLHAGLIRAVRSVYTEPGYESAKAAKRRSGYANDKTEVEIANNTIGEHFMEADFWQAVANEMGASKWQKLKRWVVAPPI